MSAFDRARLWAEAVERIRARMDPTEEAEAQRDLHELRVYEEELRVQHEALEETLARLERQLEATQLLFDDAPVPYLVVDEDGRLIRLNHAASAALGHPRGRAALTPLATLFERGSVSGFLSALKRAVSKDEPATVEVALAAGATRWALRLTVTRGLEDEPVVLISASDVTELRETEATLREARAVAERANHLRGRFLANMSHEVRTPLALILGYVETVLAAELDAEIEDRLRVVQRAGTNLLAVLNDVVDFSKVEANRLQIEEHPFDPLDAVEHVVRLFAQAAAERRIDLQLVQADDAPLPPGLVGDEKRLGQVIVNLVSNAVKHTPDDGWVTLTAAYRSGNFILTVADSGPGIPPDKLEHIFEPFGQADDSDARAHGGAGLGLTISRQVLNLMGGHLYARNSTDAGAVFTVQLPAREAEPVAAEPPAEEDEAPAAAPTPQGRVLVVDDDADMRGLFRLILEPLGYPFEIVADGAAALERLSERPYGVVLMDLQMPVMDGFEVTRRIRADEGMASIYVVALTARALKRDRELIEQAGFDAYLPKPVDFAALEQLLESRLGPPDEPSPDAG